MARIKCRLLIDQGWNRVILTRTSRDDASCGARNYHKHETFLCNAQDDEDPAFPDKDHQAWAKKCDSCDYLFKAEDYHMMHPQDVYLAPESPDAVTRDSAPVGSMYFAKGDYSWQGRDGKTLVVKTPGGWWYVDSVASNCTRRGETEHRCWERTGEAPNITAGKGGNTCSAGAGSIMIDGYHGFLRDGHLEDC